MPEYLSPGVYMEEVEIGPRPIQGVSTSTAGMVGVTEWGPEDGLPELVTSFAEYRAKFGGFLDEEKWGNARFLPYAVQGFFQNGGQRVYIKRVFGEKAEESTLQLGNGITAQLKEDFYDTDEGLKSAKLSSLRGISVGTSLIFTEVDKNEKKHEMTVSVVSYNEDLRQVSFNRSNPSGFKFSRSGALVVVTGNPVSANITVKAKNKGEWGNRILLQVEPSGKGFSSLVSCQEDAKVYTLGTIINYTGLALAKDVAVGTKSIELTDASSLNAKDTITLINSSGEKEDLEINSKEGNAVTVKSKTGFAYKMADSEVYCVTKVLQLDSVEGLSSGDSVLVPSLDKKVFEASIITVDSTGKTIEVSFANPQELKDTKFSADAKVILKKAVKTVKVASTSNFYTGAMVELDNGTNKEYRTVVKIDEVDKSLTFDQELANMYKDGDRAKLCEYKFTISNIPEKDPVLTEVFDNLNLNKSTKRYFAGVINSESKLVNITDDEQSTVWLTTPTGVPTFLQSGNDGKIPSDNDYIGNGDGGPGKRKGIKALEDIDDISIVAVPGITSQDVQNEMIIHCEVVMKDRFAVLDCGKGMNINKIREQRALYNTAYGAIYYPWLKIQDPITGKPADVPPCGHVAGIYARSDVQRGVHKAPANEVIQGITGVEVQINKGENDVINSENINAIRAFPGRGVLVWGARTMSDNTLWKYINIRRLFLYIEESIEQNTQWVVFEPNNEKLWARVKLTINQFLTGVWRSGALMGTKEEEAFFIRCDRSTMTQDDLDNGRLIVEIGIAPVKPAEFVIFRIAQWTGSSK